MHRQPDKAAFTIRALTEYDNPKSGNKTTPVQSPRFTLFGRIGQVPQDRVWRREIDRIDKRKLMLVIANLYSLKRPWPVSLQSTLKPKPGKSKC